MLLSSGLLIDTFGRVMPSTSGRIRDEFPVVKDELLVLDCGMSCGLMSGPTGAGRVSRRSGRRVDRQNRAKECLVGFRGHLFVWRSVSIPYRSELNYLALKDFGSPGNPMSDSALFEQRIAAPLLGGPSHAIDFLRFAGLLDARYPDRRADIPAAISSIYNRLPALSPEVARRWCWLANQLASFVYQ